MAFAIKDCALAAIATGVRAHNLRELRDNLSTVHPGSVYYHFWGGLLRPAFEIREFMNDFANWSRSAHGLHDEALAERLSVIDPTDFSDLEDLRQEVVEVTSERLEESEKLRLLHADRPFMFIRSQVVIFDTYVAIDHPSQLIKAAPMMTPSSFFFHFVDARRRTKDRVDDFREWLMEYGGEFSGLADRLASLDPYFTPLTELKEKIVNIFTGYFGGDTA
ncbi:MAG: DUF5752 family protein [Nitrospirota bacterium]